VELVYIVCSSRMLFNRNCPACSVCHCRVYPLMQRCSHQNECYDWGTYGWLLLKSGMVDINQYRYFFFVNSSVRGPVLPAYARVST